MKKIISITLALAVLLCAAGCGKPAAKEPEATTPPQAAQPMIDPVDDNFRTMYQIFVCSFSDSNRDGVGDLRGVINRLDYLNDGDIHSGSDLGVQGIWLSPIFKSPSYHKYDASDYYGIDWRYGSEEDLKELVAACHARNMIVILDLAINHTSRQHPWFQAFRQARIDGNTADPYYNFYSCVTTAQKKGGISYQKLAPGIDCWYECNFSGDMPELNYNNPAVKQAVVDVAQYYLDLGVDGFRFDAVKYIHYGDTNRSVAFWNWYISQLVQIKPDIYCVGECWSGDSEILEYYPAMNCFNFAMATAEGAVAAAARGQSISKYTAYVANLQKNILAKNPNGMVMGFLSNHDMDRIAGAFSTENRMRMAANLYLLAPGSPTIYYGEELGIRGSRGSENTDANRRLAMLWGDDDLVHSPTGATYPDSKQIKTTVADQLADENSMLRYYQKLIALRHKYPAIPRGVYTSIDCAQKNFGGFRVSYEGQSLGIFHNNGNEEVSYNIASYGFTQLLDFIGVSGASFEDGVLTLGPQTSAIVE